MKAIYFLAISAVALSTAACASKTPARAALDCPLNEGDLTRTAQSADGKMCTYVSADGAEVHLQLVAAPRGADMALADIETTLLANRKAPSPEEASKDAAAKAETGEAKDASLDKKIDDQVDKAVDEALADTKGVKVDGKGVKVDIDIDGDSRGAVTDSEGNTRVDLPGIHIVANERDDTANVRVGPITINANDKDDSATIRIRRDVRLRGEALNPEKRGVRAMFLYTGRDLPDGYRAVGYEAGGPKAGPITVAIMKARSDDHDIDGGGAFRDVKRLVRRNGGV